MAKPNDVLWPRARHTEAKHQLLAGYLDAWIGILGSWAPYVWLVDGFAGPGEYKDGEPGSPLRMLDGYLGRPDRANLKPVFHFLFIEENKARYEHLNELVSARDTSGASVEVDVVHGDFSEVFPDKLAEMKTRYGDMPPTFAFIDPFGAGDDAAEWASNLISLPRCEALVYVPITHLARFVDSPDMEKTLDRLYNGDLWRPATEVKGVGARKQILQDAFIERLKVSCDYVRPFEIEPSVGNNSYLLFFGTNNKLGLRRMKASMWQIDPSGGTKFRDTASVDHPVLFEATPDLGRLEQQLRQQFGDEPFSIEVAEDFTLLDTAFRDDGHLKKALKSIEAAGGLALVKAKPGRKKGTYPKQTVVRFQ